MTGVKLIAKERKRQIEVEGFTTHHDGFHRHGELAKAAVAYALFHIPALAERGEALWPWLKKWWKPDNKNAVRNLVKAGALIAAEIDRLQQLSAAPDPPE